MIIFILNISFEKHGHRINEPKSLNLCWYSIDLNGEILRFQEIYYMKDLYIIN